MGDVAGARRYRPPQRLLLSSSRASPGGAGAGSCGFSARPGLAAGGFMALTPRARLADLEAVGRSEAYTGRRSACGRINES